MSGQLLKIYQRLSWLPFGNWLFSKAICFKAPYFATIKPYVTELQPGCCRAILPNRRRVHNHIGTVHAIAQCNLAELCAGVMLDATLPSKTHRWIPRGMQVQYLQKATSDLSAIASINVPAEWQDKSDLIVPVDIFDKDGNLVFHADVTMYITAKKS
ncbi:hotdog fold domain-containing protein [Pseudoalteromonas fenneropenaei]|uniref:Hotdog fold domain-containing protein n=1 Tax=Pseudoalteromonas fenneropenaei TaxID=1737459 RepID=A0ABV7CL99_9GAMM